MNQSRNYLPSKKFLTNVLVIIVLIVLFITIKQVILYFKSKKSNNNGNAALVQTTISSFAQKDSNSNGIPDWEEYLWGLDPAKNGPENKEFIDAKKKQLAQSGIISNNDDSKTISDNELLSQQFFATIVSLQQTGQLDEASIKSVSDAIGKNIEAIPIPDTYTSNMLTVVSDTIMANDAYQTALSDLANKYSGSDIGKELIIISQGLGSKDPQALYAARTIATAYRSFGQDLVKIPVPKSLASTHLDLANNYEKVAESIAGMTQMLSDPFTGMRSVINYKKYSDALVSDLDKISGGVSQ
jgi:hypothetical protein